MGENGAGKTTIVKLLTRLYDPDEGRITVDGIDLKDFAVADIHAHIGVIFQDFIRYSLTRPREYRRRPHRGRSTTWRGSRTPPSAASPMRSSPSCPKGYDQQLGRLFKKGRDLSGGEWQKVAIARAYMRDADLIILDEPTAALDAKAEAEVFSAASRASPPARLR